MITPKGVRGEIEDLQILLMEVGAVVRTNSPIIQVRGGVTTVTWASRGRSTSTLWSGPAVTLSEYLNVLRQSDYTCLLFDGSVLQLSYEFDSRGLAKHRLCWLPCPVAVPRDLLGDIEIEEIVEIAVGDLGTSTGHLNRSAGDWLLVGPVRFDFDSEAQALGHPASHLTVTTSGCRIPVFAAMSVGHFIRTLFRHFYRDLWQNAEPLRTWALRDSARSLTAIEEQELHLEWRGALLVG